MAKRVKKIIDKKDSKRNKITFETINSGHILKPGVKLEARDMTKVYEEDKIKIEEDKIRFKNDLETEKNRFENLACPSCKSKEKSTKTISHQNGPTIYGGHNHIEVIAEYCICQSCGTMFVDLNKKKVTPPYQGMFSSPLSHRRFY